MSWEEELYITGNARRVLRKMLQIDDPYYDVEHLLKDVKKCI
jgi:serine/threonine-protein kinase